MKIGKDIYKKRRMNGIYYCGFKRGKGDARLVLIVLVIIMHFTSNRQEDGPLYFYLRSPEDFN
jgi:hypothetical protein